MEKQERDYYIYRKKGLLLSLFRFYFSNVPFDHVILRSFGFSFDPTCNFKAIVYSKKDHVHKYVIHIYETRARFNYRKRDVRGNRNIVKVPSVREGEFYEPEASRNIYFDGREFLATGYREGEKVSLRFRQKKESITDDILYHLDSDTNFRGKNESAETFILWLRKLYTCKLHVDLVIGAGINEDYGGKTYAFAAETLAKDWYLKAEEVAVSDNKITDVKGASVLTLEAGTVADSYYFHADNGKYLNSAVKTDEKGTHYNTLIADKKDAATSLFSVSFDDKGVLTVKNTNGVFVTGTVYKGTAEFQGAASNNANYPLAIYKKA